ncbi:uncharacterized protein LOC129572464 isoform X2 [Sitodiplosis mosellana]|uniref:uncharacterized protein LOC129572464 isoform X2 n=1 Tax=Sitodiplosis mosellana TaxID=263140 RepID=UPI0024441570|nr:uncharacterized protein LOC129572464 isoform X2 [Sitodiplosis mosellana]
MSVTMDEPEMDVEFCYYSGSDEADEDENQSPKVLISDYVNSIRKELENDIEVKNEPLDENNLKKIDCTQSDNDSLDDNSITSEDDTDDESTMMKRVAGRRKRAVVSVRSFRKNIRRLSRHKRLGKEKKQKAEEKDKEIEENNVGVGKEKNTIHDMNGDVEQDKTREFNVLNSETTNQEKQSEIKDNGNVEHQDENDLKDLNDDAEELKRIENKVLRCEEKINEIIDGLDDDVIIIEQQKSSEVGVLVTEKMQNDIKDNNDVENQKENEIKDLNRKLRKRSWAETVDSDNKQYKLDESEDSDQDMDSARRPKTRAAKLKAASKICIQSEPFELAALRTSPRKTLNRPKSPAMPKKLTIEPIGDSMTAYKDSIGNLYQRRVKYPNSIYLKCRGEDCPVTLIYNTENETARQIGRHSNHPTRKNDIKLIELRNLLRTKLFDPTLNRIEIHKIYHDCVAGFKGIHLPNGHYKNTIEALRQYRSKHNGIQKAEEDEKQINSSNGDQATENNELIKAKKIIPKPTEVMTLPELKIKPQRNPGNSAFEPLAGSEALFKDAKYNIYRKTTANSRFMYLKCQGDSCTVNAIYNMIDKTVRFVGKHSKHPTDSNDVLLIEFNSLMRSRALDPKYYHVKSPDLYNQCVAEFKGIELPEGHRTQSMMAINYCRKRIREIRKKDSNASLSLNESLKMHAIIPKATKIGQQPPPQAQKLLQKKPPKTVAEEEPKKACCTCNCGCHNADLPVETSAKIMKISSKSSEAEKMAKSLLQTPSNGRFSMQDSSKRQQPTILSFLTKTNKMNRSARVSV